MLDSMGMGVALPAWLVWGRGLLALSPGFLLCKDKTLWTSHGHCLDVNVPYVEMIF